MPDIGVRELKIHTSEIVNKVREKRARYIITHRGRPVAVIIPIEEARQDSEGETSTWDDLVTLGEQISQGWQSKQTSTEILSNMRR